MLNIYKNLRGDRKFQTERYGNSFAVVEYNKRGKKRLATYPTRSEAERELKIFAGDAFRWVGSQND